MPEDKGEDLEKAALLAGDLVRAGDLEQAESILLGLPAGEECSGWLQEKILSLLLLAKAQWQLGRSDVAHKFLALAEGEIRALARGSRWEAADCYLEMGSIVEEFEGFNSARDLFMLAVENAKNLEAQDVECRKIIYAAALHLADVGDYDAAIASASVISYQPLRDMAMQEIERRSG